MCLTRSSQPTVCGTGDVSFNGITSQIDPGMCCKQFSGLPLERPSDSSNILKAYHAIQVRFGRLQKVCCISMMLKTNVPNQ